MDASETGNRLLSSAILIPSLTAGLLVYEAARLLAVSGFDSSTALTILNDGGVAVLLVGTLLTSLPLLASAVFSIICQYVLMRRLGGGSVIVPASIGALLYVFCLIFTPWPAIVGATLTLLLVVSQTWREWRKYVGWRRWGDSLGTRVARLRSVAEDAKSLANEELREAGKEKLKFDRAASLISRDIASLYLAGARESAFQTMEKAAADQARIECRSTRALDQLQVFQSIEDQTPAHEKELSEARELVSSYRPLMALPTELRPSAAGTEIGIAACIVLIAATFFASLFTPIWLPEEIIHLQKPEGQMVGYVISSQPDQDTTMNARTHQIVYLPSSRIDGQTDCISRNAVIERSLGDILGGGPSPSKCPSLPG